MCAATVEADSKLGFVTRWQPRPLPDSVPPSLRDSGDPADARANRGEYSGKTEDYDCDDIGVSASLSRGKHGLSSNMMALITSGCG